MALRAVPDHPKFARLKSILRLPKGSALGWLESIWHFTGRFTPHGNIGKYSDQEIEAWVEWDGEPGTLVAALVASQWIDASEQHRLIVHDWHIHADNATKLSVKRSDKPFVDNSVATLSPQCGLQGDEPATPCGLPVPEPVPEPVPVEEQQQKPARAKRSTDPRFSEFKRACEAYYKFKSFEMTWDGSEGNQLTQLLAANPSLALDQFQGILRNRSRSAVVHSERPRKWLGNATDYAAGPLDKFGKPQEAGDAGRTFGKSKSGQVLDDLRRSLEEDGFPVGFGDPGNPQAGESRQGDDGLIRCGSDGDGGVGRSLGSGISLLPPAS